MSKSKKELGQGIRALLDDIDVSGKAAEEFASTGNLGSVSEVDISEIEINPFQPRVDFDESALKDLANSIKIHGVVQPITLRKLKSGKFQLISGERRLRASKMAGLDRIPAYIRTANDQEMLEIALIENIQREDLNAMEIGLNYQRLIDDCDINQEQLAERIGKDRSTVTNYLRLLKLPPDIQAGLKSRKIGMGHARAILGLTEVDHQLYAFNQVITNGLSVRKTEALVRDMQGSKKKKTVKTKGPAELPRAYKKVQDDLTSHFGTRVSIHRKKDGRGEIVIQYFSDEDLNRILELIDAG